jgi:hypothetical protein
MHYMNCNACHGRWERLALVTHNGLGTLPERAHRAQVARHETTRVFPPMCPVCPNQGQAMVLRANRTDGQIFWGCPLYPRCRETRPCKVNEQTLNLEFLPTEDGRSTPASAGTKGLPGRAMAADTVDLTMDDSDSELEEAP